MPENENGTQEGREEAKPERSTIQLTVEEKRAVRMLSAAELISESDLIRRFIDFRGLDTAYERYRPAVQAAQEPAA